MGNRCEASTKSVYMASSSEMMESTIASKSSSTSVSAGAEVTITAEVPVGPATVGMERTIPKPFQASSSNTETLSNVVESLDSSEMASVKSTYSCYSYMFDIETASH